MWPFTRKQPAAAAVPTPTAEVRAEARRNPNGWVYAIDGQFAPHDAVPPERIVGAWKVDERGELTGEFQANPKYKADAI